MYNRLFNRSTVKLGLALPVSRLTYTDSAQDVSKPLTQSVCPVTIASAAPSFNFTKTKRTKDNVKAIG